MEVSSLSVVDKFIVGLDKQTRSKVTRLIDLLCMKEYHLGMPYSKMIESQLYELRISGRHNIRIFYTFHDDRIVLLHVISKKTDKIPLRDLETVRERLRALQSR